MAIATIEDIVRTHGATRPQAPVSTIDASSLTWAEMDERSNRVANALRAEGVRTGDRVAVIAKNCQAIFETLFALRKLGAVQVTVNWRLAPDEMRYIVADAEAVMAFVGRELADGLASVMVQLPLVRKVIAIDGPAAHGFVPYEPWLAAAAADDPGHRSDPDAVALQLYTSGTTGRPKGVMLMNRSLFAFVRAAERVFRGSSDAVHIQALPLFHVGGMNWSLQAFAQGSHCVAFRDFDPDSVIRAIAERRATHLMTVPMVIQMLLSRPAARSADFSSLQVICYGGSTIPEKVLRDAIRTFGCGMYGMYGATELSFGATILTPEEHLDASRPELLRSCGVPLAGSSIQVVDPASLQPVPDGKQGEIWFRSPQAGLGYWKQPEASAAAFRSDGWYRTGDIGHVRDGYIYLSDRLNDMIISGGENIYPAEIERVLLEHHDVAEVVAFGIPDPKWGEAVHAVVVQAAGASADEGALIAFARQRLAHYKCPRSIAFATALPRNPSGKVQRALLREPYWAGRKRRIG
jgi:long-chain acyl-CoA synthetase